jgi:phosphoenolpyruvate-protein phosphotransferase
MVKPGDRVRARQPLLRFDLDRVARRAKSAASPIVIAAGGTIARRTVNARVSVGDFLMEVAAAATAVAGVAAAAGTARRRFRVAFEHGLHVRPAALVVGALRPFAARVEIAAHGRSADARSAVAMMALGAHAGDLVEISAIGADAESALDAIAPLFAPESAASVAVQAIAASHVEGDARRIRGVVASRGVVAGPTVQWTQAEIDVAERGAGVSGETAALDRALDTVRGHLGEVARASGGERRALAEAHSQLLDDPQIGSQARAAIGRGRSAGFAWREATRAVASVLADLPDERMRERAADLRDLENQVLRVLAGKPPVSQRELPADAIVIADELLPSQLMALEASRLGGICMARGGPTSHVALVAAATGIPLIVAAGPRVLGVADGTMAILDAEGGWLDTVPEAGAIDSVRGGKARRESEALADRAAAQAPSLTRDDVRIVVNANAGGVDEARLAAANGADGVGLLRTEFVFVDRREAPGEDEQLDRLREIAAALGGRMLTVRTLDAAGDKPLAYLPMPREDNPALGLRGVRATFLAPSLMRAQLRAILRVDPPAQCRIMFPMVNDAGELRQLRELVAECARELGREVPAVGVMIETPAAALQARELAESADFLSIGTNDLSQYTLAIDRGHPRLAAGLDALHPAMVRLMAVTADGAIGRKRSVSVCGALASDVEALPILVGLGIHEVSVTPAAVPRIKRVARSLDASRCRAAAHDAIEARDAAEVRAIARALLVEAREEPGR